MYCPNCGTYISNNKANFCSNCGRSIKDYYPDTNTYQQKTNKVKPVRLVEPLNSNEGETKADAKVMSDATLKRLIVFGAIIVFFLILALYGSIDSSKNTSNSSHVANAPKATAAPKASTNPTQRKLLTDMDAYIVAEAAVKSELLAPSTAKFCNYSKATVIYNGNHYWTVSGYVDSQNTFGAMIRQNWTITFEEVVEGDQIGCRHGKVEFS